MEQVSGFKQKLESHLRARFSERKDLSVTTLYRMPGGTSNIMYVFTMAWQGAKGPESETRVLRMFPRLGACPPYLDIRPQFEAMNRVYGKVPVPRVYWYETDKAVLGDQFMVMDKAEGESLLTVYNTQPQFKEQLTKEYIDYLVKLHRLDWQSLGLSVLGVPEHPRAHAERELKRWEWVIETYQCSPQPVLAEALVWLKRNIPASERTTFCHGDYYAHNFLCRDGHISAILDWELTCIGDPLVDLAWPAVFMNTVGGYWNEADFIKAYEQASGTTVNKDHYFFWKLFMYFRFCACALATYRNGLDSTGLDVQTIGMFCRLLPVGLNNTAKMLGF